MLIFNLFKDYSMQGLFMREFVNLCGILIYKVRYLFFLLEKYGQVIWDKM